MERPLERSGGSRARSPRSRSSRSRPRSPHHRPRSPHHRPRSPHHRPRSPHHRERSSHYTRGYYMSLRRFPHRTSRSPRRRPRSPPHQRPTPPYRPYGRSPSPFERRYSPDRRGPPDPEDLRYRLSRPRGAEEPRGWSPLGLCGKAELEESLQITVGNDFYGRSSRERTRLSGSLDNVSDVSREEFPDECILPRDRSLASPITVSDEELSLSPFNRSNSMDYHRVDPSRLHYSQRSPNRDDRREGSYSPSYKDNHHISSNISSQPLELEELARDGSRFYRDDYTVLQQEEDLGMANKSILINQTKQELEPGMPFQHEGFLDSSGSGEARSSLTSPLLQGSFNPFSSSVENFLESFTKNVNTGSVYKTLEEEQYDQHLLDLLSQNILSDDGKHSNFLGQRDTCQLKQEAPGGFSGFRHPTYDVSGLSSTLGTMVNASSVQDKRMFPTVEDEDAFIYGNADNMWHEAVSPLVASYSSQKEQVDGAMETMNENISHTKTVAETEEEKPTAEDSEKLQKVHDLLKTIGLEIGDAEIGKLSVRTRERLYGKNVSSREHRSSESQRRESVRMRTRSDTRSPETSHQYSRSPAWSVEHSKDRLSYPKSEFSMNDEDGGQQPPSPAPGQQPPSPAPAQQPPITVPAQHPTYGYTALPTPGMPLSTPAMHYQIRDYAQYNATQMLPASIDIASSPTMLPPSILPNSSVLHPGFVHNTNMPPPAFFQPSYVPDYTQYPIGQVPPNFGVPSAQNPYVYTAYGHYMHPTVTGWSSCPMPQLLPPRIPPTGPNPRNLRTIETVSDTTVRKTVENKKQDSTLVYIDTTASLPSRRPDDKNRVSQKLKVLRDLEKLKSERTVREKKLDFLKKKLELLGKRHGEILEIKSQQNDFHINPLLAQANRIEDQLLALSKEAADADQKESSLEKVAKILGLNISNTKKPPAETKNLSTEEKPEEGSSSEKTTLPVEVKAQTQVGNATSS